jgi:hypothetical protein
MKKIEKLRKRALRNLRYKLTRYFKDCKTEFYVAYLIKSRMQGAEEAATAEQAIDMMIEGIETMKHKKGAEFQIYIATDKKDDFPAPALGASYERGKWVYDNGPYTMVLLGPGWEEMRDEGEE